MNYYVYELIDPRDNTTFYIGKGSKKRAKSHFLPSSCGENPHKDNKIKQLKELGFYREDIIRFLFESQDEQKILDIEEHLIDKSWDTLTNMIRGGTQPPRKYGKDNYFYGGLSKHSIDKAVCSRNETIKNKTKKQLSVEKGGFYFIGISPNGMEYEGFNQKEFCKEHNLCRGHLNGCLSGKRKQHKGWTFNRLT